MRDVLVHPFIFNWKNKTENALRLEEHYLKIFGEVTVINSSEDYTPSHWVNLGDGAYFGNQFSQAVEMFDCDHYDILFHTQADVYDPQNNWESIVNSAKYYYLAYNYSVYAPNIDHTLWDGKVTKLDSFSSLYDDNIDVVTTTDCSCWFINSMMVSNFKNKYLSAYKKNKLGWGGCSVICGDGFMNKMPVLRDNNFRLIHPKGTAYSANEAAIKMKEFISHIEDDRLLYFLGNMRNRREMDRYLYNIFSSEKEI
jgi:hypothetical protein